MQDRLTGWVLLCFPPYFSDLSGCHGQYDFVEEQCAQVDGTNNRVDDLAGSVVTHVLCCSFYFGPGFMDL